LTSLVANAIIPLALDCVLAWEQQNITLRNIILMSNRHVNRVLFWESKQCSTGRQALLMVLGGI
jgi:hypothetical protein